MWYGPGTGRQAAFAGNRLAGPARECRCHTLSSDFFNRQLAFRATPAEKKREQATNAADIGETGHVQLPLNSRVRAVRSLCVMIMRDALCSIGFSVVWLTFGGCGVPQESGAVATTEPTSKVSAPIFSPPGGSFSVSVDVAIISDTPGAVIVFSLDGGATTAVHDGPIRLTETTEIRAVAGKAGMIDSDTMSVTFTKSDVADTSTDDADPEGDTPDNGGEDGGVVDESEPDVGTNGDEPIDGAGSASALIDASGGEIAIDGARLAVPPNGVPDGEATEFSVSIVPDPPGDVPDGGVIVGTAYGFGPENVLLDAPAAITLDRPPEIDAIEQLLLLRHNGLDWEFLGGGTVEGTSVGASSTVGHVTSLSIVVWVRPGEDWIDGLAHVRFVNESARWVTLSIASFVPETPDRFPQTISPRWALHTAPSGDSVWPSEITATLPAGTYRFVYETADAATGDRTCADDAPAVTFPAIGADEPVVFVIVPPGANETPEACEPSPNCTDTCPFANDGVCDDGGPGAAFDVCVLGADCIDCGPRE